MSECDHDMTKEVVFVDNYEFPFIICCECGSTDEEVKLKAQLAEAQARVKELEVENARLKTQVCLWSDKECDMRKHEAVYHDRKMTNHNISRNLGAAVYE